jgi:hypothetical protein
MSTTTRRDLHDETAAALGMKRIPLHNEYGLNCAHEPQLPKIEIDGVSYEGLRETQIRHVWPKRADKILAELGVEVSKAPKAPKAPGAQRTKKARSNHPRR